MLECPLIAKNNWNLLMLKLEDIKIIQEEHADTWEFVGIFADTESGTSIDKREEFQDMMDKCREGLIDLILVKQMSRFGRNTINTLQTIYELRNLGVEVYFETDELYASNSKLDFMLTMYSALAQEESRQQSVRVSSGIHERMESGNISKRVRPILGYRKDSFDKIYIYEPEAIAIWTVFMLFEGKTIEVKISSIHVVLVNIVMISIVLVHIMTVIF